MFRKFAMVFYLAVVPVYNIEMNRGKREQKEKINFTKEVPSLIAALVSFLTNDRHAKRYLCLSLMALALTIQGMLIYMVLKTVKQNGMTMQAAPLKRGRADLLGSSKSEAVFNVSKGLYDIPNHEVFQWKENFSDLDNDLANGRESKMTFESDLKNTCEAGKLPWYLNFMGTAQTRTSTVYPCTLHRYLNDLLQNNPKNDLMKHEWARIASYSQFPIQSPARPVRLAQAGFYYTGSKDTVACFSCHLEHGDWKEEDIPSAIHKQLSPQCIFLTGEDSSNIPIHEDRGPVDTNESQPVREEERGATASVTDSARSSLETMMSSSVHVKQQSLFAEKDDFSNRKEGAKHPDYADVKRRFESFKDWPCSHLISPECLVEAGFVYAGFGDCVRCFFCGIGLRNWEIGDEPWAEHARWSQKCKYVLEKKGISFVKSHLNQTDEAYTEPSASAPRLKRDKEENYRHQDNGQQITRKEDDVKQPKYNEKDNRINGKIGVTNPKTQLKSADSKSVKEENRQLKSQLTCRVCMDKSNNTVFLPCGHLVTCELCSGNVAKCPICRTKIQTRIKAFLG